MSLEEIKTQLLIFLKFFLKTAIIEVAKIYENLHF
jgi:hypothetical protein